MNEHVALSPSKRLLMEKLLRGGGAAADKPAPIQPRDPAAPLPLSADQRQVWLHAMMAPDVPLYNESITIHRFGSFDADAMAAALTELLRRHEAWRTGFHEVDGELVQRVAPPAPLVMPFHDVSHLPEAERDEAARAIGGDDACAAIPLTQPPLLRVRIVRIAPDNHRLYLTLHHIIFDGVSIYRVIVPELAALYEAFAAGQLSPLPEPTLHYGDYTLWQQAHLQSPAIRKQLAYWREALADAPPRLELLGDRAKPARPTHAGSMEVFTIPFALNERLKQVSREAGATLYMTLLAAYHVLLHRYSGEEDIVVGGVTDLRRRPELENVVGYFLNTIALRAHPRGELPFSSFLRDVRGVALAALAASEAPFDEVVRELGLRREPGKHPLFNCLFSIEPPVAPFPPGWDLTQMDVVVGGAKFDLYLELDERADGMHARFLFSTELFDAATIRRMSGHWLTILAAVADDPDRRIADLPLLTAEEEYQLAVEWNDMTRPAPAAMLPEAIAAQIVEQPQAVAIRCEGIETSYATLDAQANAIAAALEVAGVERGALVAVCLDRSPTMVAALLAIHRVGAAYLPLDSEFPAVRLAYIVADAGPALLLTDTDRAVTLPDWGLPKLLIDHIEPVGRPCQRVPAAPEDLAYVLYTSGSTGNPKGVEISHGALINLLTSMRAEPGLREGETLLAVTTLSFDIAALEIFLPLIAGGTLLLAPRDVTTDPRHLADLFVAERPDVMQATPATWRALIEAGWRGDPHLRILCGGEALPRDLADALLARAGEVWNVYGPTETTIWSALACVTHDDGAVPIGRPIANTTIHILDRQGRHVPIGVPGELYIGGAGLARGYRKRPDLTAERFEERHGERLYRTGDLARYRADGNILCLGRVDNDEKIRGFRVAVEEIEGALANHPAIAAAAVRGWPDASGERSLAAYVVPSGKAPDTPTLRAYLAERLPAYMIPARFEMLEALPMTPNGKIDRKALPSPIGATSSAGEPPQGATEQQLAALWRVLLGVDAVHRDDNFFDLGGHSLLVARLLMQIERKWGRRLGIAAFFEALTLAKLAAVIDVPEPADTATLIRLQPLGYKTPLLWLDGGPRFRPLALGLGDNRPFLGVALGPVLDKAMAGEMTIESVAAATVAAIRTVRPHGPYLIGGWCTFGILAYEVARQLRAAGHAVPLLVLGHSSNPVDFQRVTSTQMRLSKVRYHARQWARLPWQQRWTYALDRARGVLEEAGVTAEHATTVGRLRTGALEAAAYRYSPLPYAGDVALFQPVQRLDVLDTEPGWRELVTGRLTAFDVPGDHGSMTDPPQVETFAARLREALDAAG